MNSRVAKVGSIGAENVISKLGVLETSLISVVPNLSTPAILNEVTDSGAVGLLSSSEQEKIVSAIKRVIKNLTMMEVNRLKIGGFPFPETLHLKQNKILFHGVITPVTSDYLPATPKLYKAVTSASVSEVLNTLTSSIDAVAIGDHVC